MTSTRVGRWGNSLAIRLPDHVAKQAGIAKGDLVEIEQDGRSLVIRKIKPITPREAGSK